MCIALKKTESPYMARTLDERAGSERTGCPYVARTLIERARRERTESPCTTHPYVSFARVPWGGGGWSRADHVDDLEC